MDRAAVDGVRRLLRRLRVVHGPDGHPVRPRAAPALDRRRPRRGLHRPPVAHPASDVPRLVDLHHRHHPLRLRARSRALRRRANPSHSSSRARQDLRPRADPHGLAAGELPARQGALVGCRGQHHLRDAFHPAVRRRRHPVGEGPSRLALVRDSVPRALLPRLCHLRDRPHRAPVVRQPGRRDRRGRTVHRPRAGRSFTSTRPRRSSRRASSSATRSRRSRRCMPRGRRSSRRQCGAASRDRCGGRCSSIPRPWRSRSCTRASTTSSTP